MMIRFNKRVTRISQILAVIGAIILLGMMIIIVLDVGGRYLFNAPLPGANELAGILLVVVASWGIGYCQLLKKHISIDIIYTRFNPKGQSVLNIIANAAFIVVGVLICWQMFVKTYEYINKPQLTEILGIPLWPFMLILAIGFGWASLVYFIELIKLVKGVIKGESS